MRILFLTQHYRPEPNFITAAVAEAFAKGGHTVHVITAHPNYPLGRFYDSVSSPQLPKRTIENGVTIWRLPMIPDHGKSKFRRAVSYISFLFMSLLCILITQLFFRPHRVFVYQTPFSMAVAALPFRLIAAKVIFICADLWPESLVASGLSPNTKLLNALYAYSRWINRRADLLITSTNGMRDRYIADGIPDKKVVYIPVWVDGIPSKLPQVSPKMSYPRKLVYAGNIGPAQNIGTIIRAMENMQHLSDKLVFEIWGTGSEEPELKSLVESKKLTNVIFKGRCSPEQAFSECNMATACIVHLVASPLFRMTLPSKLSSCLASGVPLICGVDGEANTMFSEFSGVSCFPSGDSVALARILRDIAQMSEEVILERGQMSRRLYLQFFERKVLLDKYTQACLNVGC